MALGPWLTTDVRTFLPRWLWGTRPEDAATAAQKAQWLYLVRGHRQPPERMQTLERLLREDPRFADWRIRCFDYRSSVFSNQRLRTLGLALAIEMNRDWLRFSAEGVRPEISMLAFASGGLIAQQAWLEICGEAYAADSSPYECAQAVKALVLLESPNHGYVRSRMPWLHRRVLWVCRATDLGKLFRDAMEGSAFVTSLRIGWLRARAKRLSVPRCTQLVGSADHVVDPADTRAMPDTRQVPLAGTTHRMLGSIASRGDPAYEHVVDALLDAPLRDRISAAPVQVSAHLPVDESLQPFQRFPERVGATEPTHVVFILHGIRDAGHWRAALGRSMTASDGRVQVVYPRYRYFSLAQFTWRPARIRRVNWLRRAYFETVAQYPSIPISVVAHSNACFLVAAAMRDCPSIRFDRVYLAGCVLTEGFDWMPYLDTGQVGALRNDMASHDIPVGWFARALGLCDPEIGASGSFGFEYAPGRQNVVSDDHTGFPPSVAGGHAAALAPENHPSIVDFVVGRQRVGPGEAVTRAHPTAFFAFLSRTSVLWVPFCLLGGLAAAFFLGVPVLCAYLVVLGVLFFYV